MYKMVVVGFDGHDRSRSAVVEAASLTRALGATLHVVMAVPKDRLRDLDGGPERRDVDSDSARQKLAELAESLADVTVTTAAVKGSPAEVILNETARVGGDLIAVGNKNVQGIGRVLGSVADDITKKAGCAVLVVNTSN